MLGVYKGQSRNQLITVTISADSWQRTCSQGCYCLNPPSARNKLWVSLSEFGTGEKSVEAMNGYDNTRPTNATCLSEMAWIVSRYRSRLLTESTRQTTRPTKNSYAPPSKNELLICHSFPCLDLVRFPVLSQINPQAPLLVVPFHQFKFSLVTILFLEPKALDFLRDADGVATNICRSPHRHWLWLGLWNYLLVLKWLPSNCSLL